MMDDLGLLFCCVPSESAVCVKACRSISGDAVKQYKSEPASNIEHIALVGSDYLIGSQRTKPFIYVWALQKEQVHMRMSCPGRVTALAVSMDGVYCAAGVGSIIHIWEVCSGHLMATGSRHFQSITVLRFTDDGTNLISGGDDNLVVVWNMSSLLSEAYISSGLQLPVDVQGLLNKASSTVTRHAWSDHSLPINDIYCSVGGLRSRVATVSLDQTCKLYELGSGKMLCSFLFDCGLTKVTMDTSMSRLFVGSNTGDIWQVNLFLQALPSVGAVGSTNNEAVTNPYHNGHSKKITGLCVTAYGNVLISGSADTTVRVWDIATQQTLKLISMKASVTDMILTLKTPATVTSMEPFKAANLAPLNWFEKQPHFATVATSEQGSTTAQGQAYNGAIPIRINGIDPLEDLEKLDELKMSMDTNCLSDISFDRMTEEDGSIEGLNPTQLAEEVCKLKDIHQTLYNFSVKKVLNSDRTFTNNK